VVTAARPARLPSIEFLDGTSAAIFATTVAPLFEGAPGFLGRLAAARPFGSFDALFDGARRIAHGMPMIEQIELIDAHPRHGAPAAEVSALSFVEQGYESEAAQRAAQDAEADVDRVARELDRLNEAYEQRFGFRYCTFVAGRPRAALLPGIAAALEAERSAEIARALDAVVDIARDRADRLGARRGGAA
jgi:2-oxo-4-hydroxy-4-carboxy-5-ureidoimidazoline decarboxylase